MDGWKYLMQHSQKWQATLCISFHVMTPCSHPYPSTMVLSILQPCLINHETTPPLSFHLSVLTEMPPVFPDVNRFHRHTPRLLLSKVRGQGL